MLYLNGVVDSNDALKIAGYVVNDSLLSDMQEKVADVNPLTHKVRGYIENEVIKKYRDIKERNESQ